MGGGAMGLRMMAGGEPVEGQEAAGMQPVADIEAALSTARDLLSGGTGVQTQEAMDGQTWNRAKADRQMQRQPGGPMTRRSRPVSGRPCGYSSGPSS